MEAQLREYRARRRREEFMEKTKEKLEETKERSKEKISGLVPNVFSMEKKKEEDQILLLDDEPLSVTPPPLLIPEPESEESEEEVEETIPETWRYFLIKWTIYFIIWLTLYLYFLKVGFGAVFFAISLLVGICLNTRTRRKKKGEASAYSVFNQDFEKLDGTLDAEDLQRQMLFGVAGIRMG